jgi:2-methylcitrate dehydratase
MSSTTITRPIHAADRPIVEIAEYAAGHTPLSGSAYRASRLSFIDAIGCAFEALEYPACTKLLGPIVPGTVVPNGAKVPGTPYQLDPVKAAFDLGAMIRWLDFNDTWLAAEWGHPSDSFGGILATADWLSRTNTAAGKPPLIIRDVLAAGVRAYEIQGCLALENSFNRRGLDHVVLVKVASTAVVTQLLGGTVAQIVDALSQAWVDGQSLRTYRHAPNTGSRKSWAAGDATSRAVRLALMTMAGEHGYPTALSAKTWGFCDVLYGGEPLATPRSYGSYVIEHVLFKISFPAEFHAQTAIEAAVTLHPLVRHRLDEIASVRIRTHESAIRIIDKQGPLSNPADRDHCIQYMTAVALIKGNIVAADYEDAVAADPRIDVLRAKITCVEEPLFSREYLDPDKRSIANEVQIVFTDGTVSPPTLVEYPIGHPRRRDEGMPLLEAKFRTNLQRIFAPGRANAIFTLCTDQQRLEGTPVHEFVDLLVP